ncbi:E3 ubiquitin-protein ligase march2-like isoform x1 [Thalictrum thalictroides]|uniref:E3 ubiquitin-protein ligase march2-like isoform x1 n=1 Tax=Thalictrum thalictroides TaxID=46969 RepID=A0A7J6V6W6_THATH|nr:E3 ubiquitin-protein ligase march2-like isoform x1 [Thalictrum thalictroides]
MKNHGEGKSDNMVGDHCIDISKLEKQGAIEILPKETPLEGFQQIAVQTLVTVVITNTDSSNQFVARTDTKGSAVFCPESQNPSLIPGVSDPKLNLLKVTATETLQLNPAVSTTKKTSLSRSESFHDYCRVCQQQAEEALIDLGCQCRGGLAKAHRSCIDTWFRTRGSNKCEICQQVAINVPPPESQPSRNYWVWRVDPSFRGPSIAPERERGCYSPLWVAFSILIGGLLLDVLISISLGVSALPVNIIIGVLVVLGLGTALRLALECCHELTLRRTVQGADTTSIGPLGYHPAV